MYVGVIPPAIGMNRNTRSIPHVCGGDPLAKPSTESRSPVFPMYVGVIMDDN